MVMMLMDHDGRPHNHHRGSYDDRPRLVVSLMSASAVRNDTAGGGEEGEDAQ